MHTCTPGQPREHATNSLCKPMHQSFINNFVIRGGFLICFPLIKKSESGTHTKPIWFLKAMEEGGSCVPVHQMGSDKFLLVLAVRFPLLKPTQSPA